MNKKDKQNLPLSEKIIGSFNETEYILNEQNTLIITGKKYTGTINGRKTEYTLNPEKDIHKGKIQGKIGNDRVNLFVSSDLFGNKTISGLYNRKQIELTVSKDFFGTNIEGKNTAVNIKRNFFSLNKSFEGKFEYDNKLMPLILSYIKYLEDLRTEVA